VFVSHFVGVVRLDSTGSSNDDGGDAMQEDDADEGGDAMQDDEA